MVLAVQLNSKNFICIQAVKLMEMGSHVVLVHQLNSKDFSCIQAVRLIVKRSTCGTGSSAQL